MRQNLAALMNRIVVFVAVYPHSRTMKIDPTTYPSRAFIRFTAQNQLLADLTGEPMLTMVKRSGGENYAQQVKPDDRSILPASESAESASLDEALFEEIAKTTFHINHHPELYKSCGTQQAASQVEAHIAAEIVETYKQIKRRQEWAIVQRLNALL